MTDLPLFAPRADGARWRTRPARSVELMDAEAFLASIAPKTVDLVIVDPAYPSLEKHRNRGTTTRLAHSAASSNDWFDCMTWAQLRAMVVQIERVLAPGRHAYVICDEETADAIKRYAWDAGLYCWGSLTWLKTRKGKLRAGLGYHYRRCDERIVFLEKRTTQKPAKYGAPLADVVDASGYPLPWGDGRQLNDRAIMNALPADELVDPDPNVVHADLIMKDGTRTPWPTEKPVDLLSILVSQSTQPGELVIDPCCGSGSTLEAAVALGRRAWGADIAPRALELTQARLALYPERTGS